MNEITCVLSPNVGRVLSAVAAGEDMTKLEIRERTALSMTTVIGAVDALCAAGLVTFEEVRGEHGGKMRSVINPHPDRRVYGISYQSGVLTAVAADLRGEMRESLSKEVGDEIPSESVTSLAYALKERAPVPAAVALSLNCEGRGSLLERLSDILGAPCVGTSGAEGIAHLALWRGAPLPIAVIGIGSHVKCALLSESESRSFDMGSLDCPRILTREGDYRAALSAEVVEEILRGSRYRGMMLAEGSRIREIRDLADYSRALALSISSLVRIAEVTLAPRRIVLYGDYLSEAFCDRIGGEGEISYLRAEREDLALGSALCAMRRVFSLSPPAHTERTVPTE